MYSPSVVQRLFHSDWFRGTTIGTYKFSNPKTCDKSGKSRGQIVPRIWNSKPFCMICENANLWRIQTQNVIKSDEKWTLHIPIYGTIPARFGLIWFRGFRGEDLNVKVYDVRRMPSDGKSSHGLWPGELKKQKQVWFTCLTRVSSFLPTLYVTVSSTFNQVPGDKQLFIL
jgi:hypothetical protein